MEPRPAGRGRRRVHRTAISSARRSAAQFGAGRPGAEWTAVTAVPPRLARFFEPDSPTQQLAARLADAGHRAYLVGGSVRDAFLDRDEHVDVDIATDARPDAIEAVVQGWADAVWLQGQRFGTVGVREGRRALRDHDVPRRRLPPGEPQARGHVLRRHRDRPLAPRLHGQRDGARARPSPELVDPFGGLADLAAPRLRTPLSPEVSFGDDPLRMLRAARFVATLGFEPDAASWSTRSSAMHERLRDRQRRAHPRRAVEAAARRRSVARPLADRAHRARRRVPARAQRDASSSRIRSTATRTCSRTRSRSSPRRRRELKLRLAALLHDVGKPRRAASDRSGVTFHHHEVVGARMARERLLALRYPNDIVDDVTQLVELHLRFHTYRMGWTDSAVRRYVRDAGPLLDELNELTRCDCTTRNARKAAGARPPHGRARGAHRRAARAGGAGEDPARRSTATQVMEFLGVDAGPGRRRGARRSCSSCDSTRARSARKLRTNDSRPGRASAASNPPRSGSERHTT